MPVRELYAPFFEGLIDGEQAESLGFRLERLGMPRRWSFMAGWFIPPLDLWCLSKSESGKLPRDPRRIALICHWPVTGKAREFVRALIESGFIDERPDGLYVHNFEHYLKRVLRDRRRKRGVDSMEHSMEHSPELSMDHSKDEGVEGSREASTEQSVEHSTEHSVEGSSRNRNRNRNLTEKKTKEKKPVVKPVNGSMDFSRLERLGSGWEAFARGMEAVGFRQDVVAPGAVKPDLERIVEWARTNKVFKRKSTEYLYMLLAMGRQLSGIRLKSGPIKDRVSYLIHWASEYGQRRGVAPLPKNVRAAMKLYEEKLSSVLRVGAPEGEMVAK